MSGLSTEDLYAMERDAKKRGKAYREGATFFCRNLREYTNKEKCMQRAKDPQKESEREFCSECALGQRKKGGTPDRSSEDHSNKTPAHQPKNKERVQYCQANPASSSDKSDFPWKNFAAYKPSKVRGRITPAAYLSDDTLTLNAAVLRQTGIKHSCDVSLFFDAENRKIAVQVIDSTSGNSGSVSKGNKLRLTYRNRCGDARLAFKGARNHFGISEYGRFVVSIESADVLVIDLQDKVYE